MHVRLNQKIVWFVITNANIFMPVNNYFGLVNDLKQKGLTVNQKLKYWLVVPVLHRHKFCLLCFASKENSEQHLKQGKQFICETCKQVRELKH